MDHQHEHPVPTSDMDASVPVARRPYETPVLETLGATLATLLASGCAPCTICPPALDADTP